MGDHALVLGVGMVPFATPSRAEPYDVMAEGAVRAALLDAGLDYADMQQAYVGYVYGDSTVRPERALPGRPDRHPDRQRQQQLLDGLVRAVPGAPGRRGRRGRLRAGPRVRADAAAARSRPSGPTARARSTASTRCSTRPRRPGTDADAPLAPRYFGGAGREHMPSKYGTSSRPSRQSRAKARRHAAKTLYALFRKRRDASRRSSTSPRCSGRCDAAAVLPADLRRRCRGPRARTLREEARPHRTASTSRRRR